MKRTILLTTLLILLTLTGFSQENSDQQAVKKAVLNYVEGFYEGDTSKLLASIHPTLSKYGYYVPRNSTDYEGEEMTFQGALDYATSVKSKKHFAREGSPKEVRIFEVQNQTAVAKLTAWWGTDYIMLAKEKGEWMIMKVIWQSPPK